MRTDNIRETGHIKRKERILFSDMDGTLLRNDSTVSPHTKAVLDRMTAAGHRLVLTSGRPLDSMLEVMEEAGLFYPDTLLIAYNGSLTWDCTAHAPLFFPYPSPGCMPGNSGSRQKARHSLSDLYAARNRL